MCFVADILSRCRVNWVYLLPYQDTGETDVFKMVIP